MNYSIANFKIIERNLCKEPATRPTYWSARAMSCEGYRVPSTGIVFRILSRAVKSSSFNSAGFMFSVTRSAVVAPGIGKNTGFPFFPLCANIHPIANCAGVHPLFFAIFSTSWTSFRFWSKTSGWNRGKCLRYESSGISLSDLICPV